MFIGGKPNISIFFVNARLFLRFLICALVCFCVGLYKKRMKIRERDMPYVPSIGLSGTLQIHTYRMQHAGICLLAG